MIKIDFKTNQFSFNNKESNTWIITNYIYIINSIKYGTNNIKII